MFQIERALKLLTKRKIITFLGKYPSSLVLNDYSSKQNTLPIDIYRKIPPSLKLLREISEEFGVSDKSYLDSFDQIGCKAVSDLNKLCSDIS